MEHPDKKIHSGDVDLEQIDNQVIDIYKPRGKDYPIIERTDNALLWPDKIKDGIDLIDTNSLINNKVNLNPHTELNKK
jgi:hypothetical protein